MMHVQGTTVACAGEGVLLRGPSGAGKSDLALRLIERGAKLIADDLTVMRPQGLDLVAFCPPGFAGRIEARGVGIICVNCAERAPLRLVIDLADRDQQMRLTAPRDIVLFGHVLPAISLHAFDQSAPLKVELALEHVLQEAGRPANINRSGTRTFEAAE